MMRLEIISSERVLFKGNVLSVTFPGSMGAFTVLDQHAPLVSTLTSGSIIYNVNGNNKEIAIKSGVVEVFDNKVVVCIS